MRLPGQLPGVPAVVYSSPSLRCIATVLPLARAHGLEITTLATLYEGGSADAMLDRLRGEPSPVVACTHGDVLADLVGVLIRAGVRLPSQHVEKASTWTLELRDGVISSARYAPPP